jgi:Putative transmembrane protein (PGPGW)
MPTSAAPQTTGETAPATARPERATDGLGEPVDVPHHGWRDRVRSNPGLRQAYRVGVFAAGLLCIAAGVALMVLPGPLTIPPILLGLWIWSTEFAFAQRFFDTFKGKARDAWAHAKAHPVTSACITGGGLLAAGAAFWAISHFRLVDMAKDAVL